MNPPRVQEEDYCFEEDDSFLPLYFEVYESHKKHNLLTESRVAIFLR